MSRYVNYSLGLSEGQRTNLAKAYKDKSCLTLRLTNNQLTGDFPMALTQTQVKKIQKAKASGTGIQIEISKTQMAKQTQNGGFLGALAKLALPVVKTVASKLLPALGIGAASALAETGVKKVLGRSVSTSGAGAKGLRPGPEGSSGLSADVPHNKITTLLQKPYVDHLTKAQKEQLQAALKKKRGTGLRITKRQQTGGFLGMLASLAVPMLAGLLGKGLQVDSVPRPYIMQKKRSLNR